MDRDQTMTWIKDFRIAAVSLLLAMFLVVSNNCHADADGGEQNLEIEKPLNDTGLPQSERAWTASINLAGPALWGLSCTGEWGSKFAGQLRLRSMNAAWMPYFTTGTDATFKWGVGVATGFRVYPLADIPLSRMFIGLNVEYLHVAGDRPHREWSQGYLIPQVEAGYRWMFQKVFVGVGASYGPMIPLFVKEEFWEGTKVYQDKEELNHFVELILELGVKF